MQRHLAGTPPHLDCNHPVNVSHVSSGDVLFVHSVPSVWIQSQKASPLLAWAAQPENHCLFHWKKSPHGHLMCIISRMCNLANNKPQQESQSTSKRRCAQVPSQFSPGHVEHMRKSVVREHGLARKLVSCTLWICVQPMRQLIVQIKNSSPLQGPWRTLLYAATSMGSLTLQHHGRNYADYGTGGYLQNILLLATTKEFELKLKDQDSIRLSCMITVSAKLVFKIWSTTRSFVAASVAIFERGQQKPCVKWRASCHTLWPLGQVKQACVQQMGLDKGTIP